MKYRWSPIVGVLASLLTGCGIQAQGQGQSESVGQTSSAIRFWDYDGVSGGTSLPFWLFGRDLNGQDLNGRVLNGHFVVAVSLNDVEIGGKSPEKLRLNASTFQGPHLNGASQRSIVGAMFTGRLDDGEAIRLRIDDTKAASDPWNYDVLTYLVSYQSDGTWKPLCGVDPQGKPIMAVPLNGTWDHHEGTPSGGSHADDAQSFTWACEGHVLAKCAERGYKPWATGLACNWTGKARGCSQIDFAEYHQACTRALRADYCGNGTSHTKDGVWVNIYDGIGLRVDSDPWPFEAEWTPAGARCVVSERLATDGPPPCGEKLTQSACGDLSHFGVGATLMSEVEPNQ